MAYGFIAQWSETAWYEAASPELRELDDAVLLAELDRMDLPPDMSLTADTSCVPESACVFFDGRFGHDKVTEEMTWS